MWDAGLVFSRTKSVFQQNRWPKLNGVPNFDERGVCLRELCEVRAIKLHRIFQSYLS